MIAGSHEVVDFIEFSLTLKHPLEKRDTLPGIVQIVMKYQKYQTRQAKFYAVCYKTIHKLCDDIQELSQELIV